jgi:hypothetical protein
MVSRLLEGDSPFAFDRLALIADQAVRPVYIT